MFLLNLVFILELFILVLRSSAIKFEVEGATKNAEGDADVRVTKNGELLCLVEAKVHLPQDRRGVALECGSSQRLVHWFISKCRFS